jgi:Caspase domain
LEFRRAVRDFMLTAQSADIAVVYYAGHGIEKGGTNYLIPVDARLLRDYDAEDEAVSLDRIIAALQPARQLRLIILDACREDPFAPRGHRDIVARAIEHGLAKIEPSTPDTLIAYAAKAGSLSFDGDGGPNSPFTAALVKYLAEPGVDIRIALGQVRDEVLKNTGNRQEPFTYGSLGGTEVSLVPAPERKRNEAPAEALDPDAAALRDFELAERTQVREVWESFLAKHKEGFYADLARARLKELIAAERPKEGSGNGDRLDTPLSGPDVDEILRLVEKGPPGTGGQAAKATGAPPHERPRVNPRQGQDQEAALTQRSGESAQVCEAAAQRLVRLRADPKRDDVIRFAHDLTCEPLRPQVLRLLESVGASVTNAPPPAGVQASPPPTTPAEIGQSGIATPKLKADVEENRARRKASEQPEANSDSGDTCRREEATLMRLRARPQRDEVIGFARNLTCEQLRPQVARLLESMGN